MNFIKISETVSEAHGMGNNWEETITKVYKCPRGKSSITTEIETTTGHKNICTTIDCLSCVKKYRIANGNSRNWSIELIDQAIVTMQGE